MIGEDVMRRNIYDVLKSGSVDLEREYSRLYELFYCTSINVGFSSDTLEGLIDDSFDQLNRTLIGRCISLEDFNDTYDYNFEMQPENFDIEYLISFAEYVINFLHALWIANEYLDKKFVHRVIENTLDCMEDIGYEALEKEGITIFVKKDVAADSVAEIVEEKLAYSVLEYNHHALKGDLQRKKSILKAMAEDIEPQRKNLNNINKSYSSDLFQLLNKFIRHDTSKNEQIEKLTEEKREEIYDDIYQMWLLAKLMLDHMERKDKISTLIDYINVNPKENEE